jgi:uncharacterized protein HemX
MPPTAPAFASVIGAVAAQAQVQPTALVAAPGPPAVVANAPFTITVVSAGAAAGSSSSSGSSAGGVVGGIIGALALAVGIWAYRSWAKHGVLPCLRNRAKEKRAELERLSKLTNVSRELDERSSKADALAKEVAELKRKLAEGGEAKKAADADADFAAVNPLSGAGVTRIKFGPQSVA